MNLNPWIVIVGVAATFLILLVAGTWVDIKQQCKKWAKQWEIGDQPEAVSQRVFLALAELDHVKLEQQGTGTITVRQSRLWKVLLAFVVLFFPLGLLLLFIRERKTAVITLLSTETGTRMVVNGPVMGSVRSGLISQFGPPKAAA